MSLRHRLLLQLFAVLGLSLLIAAALAYWRAASKVRTELHAALVVGEQVLIDAVKEIDRAPNPHQQLRTVIERFNGGRHVKVALIDKYGERVTQSRISTQDNESPEWFTRIIGGAPEAARVELPASVPSYKELRLETDPRNEVLELWEDLGYGLFAVTLLAGLAGALIYWTIGRELRPLTSLGRSFSGVAEGDFSVRVPEDGPGDLRAVCRGFNEMAARLEESDSEKVALELQLSSIQEEERAELARDLHDEVGPLLFSAAVDAAEAEASLADAGQILAISRLESIRDAIRLSQKHVLRLLGTLRTGTVEDLGLEGPLAALKEFWERRQPGLKVRASVPEAGTGEDLDPVIYRVVQEGMSNAVRHGRPTSIDIDVTASPDGTTKVFIADNGEGLKSSRPGRGLTGMRERVASRHGTLVIGNRPDGRGTLVVAEFPAIEIAPLSVAQLPEPGLSL